VEEDHTLVTKRSFGAILAVGLIFAACTSGGTASQSAGAASPSTAASEAPSGGASPSAGTSQAPTGFAACGNEKNGDGLKVGGVTDVGQLEDKSFNEAGWCGTLKGATAVNGTAAVIVTKQPQDYAQNIQTFIDQGFDVIVTYGFNLGQATAKAAKANPDTKFVGIDQFICVDERGDFDGRGICRGDASKLLPNYQGLNFAENQAGYLAGIIAGSLTKTNKIGTIGGIKTVPPVPQYMGGYCNGALSANPNMKIEDCLTQFVSTDITKAFNLPDVGRTIANQMIDQGADVIFQVAGGSGQGALEAVCAKNLLGIGVDVDQFLSSPSVSKCIVTSAEKKLVDSTAAAIGSIDAGTNPGGNQFLNAASKPPGIGLSPYHDFESLITPEIQAKVDKALADMAAGTLDPCKGPGVCFFDPDK